MISDVAQKKKKFNNNIGNNTLNVDSLINICSL